MAIKPTLQHRQTQRLFLSPKLKEAISVLQMGHLELSEFIASEVLSNPLLEYKDDKEFQADVAETPKGRIEVDKLMSQSAPAGGSLPDDPSSESHAGAYFSPKGNGAGTRSVGDGAWLENIGQTQTLAEHLREQISMSFGSESQRALAKALVDEVDDDGFIRSALDELAFRHGKDEAEIKAAIELIQQCEPVGIGARSLGECFRLQLADLGALTPEADRLLDRIRDLTGANIDAVQNELGVSDGAFQDILALLRGLSFAPGHQFSSAEIQYITPDVIVSKGNQGAWIVDLNPDIAQNFSINSALSKSLPRNGEGRLFVDDCNRRAGWLVRVLEQRADTILKTAREIVRRQAGFFEKGAEQLVPMTMRDVASEIDVHESTVSRVATGKFLSCPSGVYEFRFFFSSSVPTANSTDGASSVSVKNKIRKLIDEEEPQSVLSDDKIVKLLGERGIDIARRTVTKYRETMQIPSSVERRRIKKRFAKLRT